MSARSVSTNKTSDSFASTASDRSLVMAEYSTSPLPRYCNIDLNIILYQVTCPV